LFVKLLLLVGHVASNEKKITAVLMNSSSMEILGGVKEVKLYHLES
jgi:hypothetical protein